MLKTFYVKEVVLSITFPQGPVAHWDSVDVEVSSICDCICLASGAPIEVHGFFLHVIAVFRSVFSIQAPEATSIVNLGFNSWTHSSFRCWVPVPHVTEQGLQGPARHLDIRTI